jgi:hypothetical protein
MHMQAIHAIHAIHAINEDTYVYIHFTYVLQECVYFRQDAHTAAEQTPTPTYHTTTSHTNFIQVKG